MRGKFVKILNLFVLLVLAGALTGFNICSFYCVPCGHEYVLINTLPQDGKCYCDVCRNSCCASQQQHIRKACCGHTYKSKARKISCCSVEKKGKAHKHTRFKHTFYKITDTFQTEPTLDIEWMAVVPEQIPCLLPTPANFCDFIQETKNIFFIKAPPLEWLCTYLC